MDIKTTDKEVLELIKSSIGPSPWYWNTFPIINSKQGNQYKWDYDEKKIEWVPYLKKAGSEDNLIMVIDSYISAFSLPDGEMGIWYPRTQHNPYKFLSIEFEIFNLDKLASFTFKDITKDFKKNDKKPPYFCKGTSIAKFSIATNLKPGENRYKFPGIFNQVNEFLFVCGYPYEKAAYSIIQLQPKEEKIFLFPQYWFNGDDCDLGYEWITRVVKDPKTGIIYGDGIRISPFELEKDNVTYKRRIR